MAASLSSCMSIRKKTSNAERGTSNAEYRLLEFDVRRSAFDVGSFPTTFPRPSVLARVLPGPQRTLFSLSAGGHARSCAHRPACSRVRLRREQLHWLDLAPA